MNSAFLVNDKKRFITSVLYFSSARKIARASREFQILDRFSSLSENEQHNSIITLNYIGTGPFRSQGRTYFFRHSIGWKYIKCVPGKFGDL